MRVDSYLFFDGNCEEAMNFYANALDGEVSSINRFSEGPMEVPDEAKNRVMHGTIEVGDTTIFFSDTMPDQQVALGNNFSMSIDCDSPEQQDKHYAAISEGGDAVMPVEETFWGARFGMCIDKYGVSWMFSYHAPEQS